MTRRSAWRRNLVLLTSAAICSGLLFLFLGPARPPAPPPGLETMAFVEGTLTVVEADRLVLAPFGDKAAREIEFTIRPEDAGRFDIAHMRSHSSVALPARIYYDRRGLVRYARYKADAQVNGDGS